MTLRVDWASALLDSKRPCPSGLQTWNGSDAAQRFGIHRNNVLVSLVDILSNAFPVTRSMVGAKFFGAMGATFVRLEPPSSAVLLDYGESFPDFVAHFSPAQPTPYLADLARLEWARIAVLHAAEVAPIPADAIATATENPATLPKLCLHMAPQLRSLDSAFAVYSLWAAHQGEWPIETTNAYAAESVWIYRHENCALIRRVTYAQHKFVDDLRRGSTLLEAVAAAASAEPAFDLPATLAELLRLELVVGLTYHPDTTGPLP